MFEDIRPYEGEEIARTIKELCEDAEFCGVASKLPGFDINKLRASADRYTDVVDFQRDWERPLLEWVVKANATDLQVTGVENISDGPQLFLTNHRDITIDPAFMALSLMRTKGTTCEIAIGNNLFVRPWIEKFVRLSRSFAVKRNLSKGEMLSAFSELSAYVRHSLTEKKSKIWMAQREGRSKDSTDLTQESLIKMLAMSGEGTTIVERLKPLNICPTTLSYEFDPCDYLKAAEFQAKRDNPDFKKGPNDDFISMREGIRGNHGRISIHFGRNISDEMDEIGRLTPNRKEQAEAVCKACDREIHSHYIIYPINEWAYEQRFGEGRFHVEEPERWEGYLRCQLAKIEISNKDDKFLWQKMIEMYSNPVINKLNNQY